MINIPVLRWGRPYTSLEVDNVIHFSTGETLAKVSQANPGLLAKDIRQALPSNSPGVHTLWLPVVPMQIGLVLKPGPQEPWTPYRMAAAFREAGVPPEAISIYPGAGEMGAEVVNRVHRTKIFGSTETVKRYEGNPRVQVHGPGFSKVLLGDDAVDEWEKYIELIAEGG